ncbi:MAG TPA: molybdopterin-binding protein [Rhizomicrobium sp.]|jgi:molybdenum cofactor synthesis domain-containing protein|nr:molybdopterin-binding protein [Rhizomicrobium sp.]
MSKSAAILVIGDEILSGRTQDTNSGHIARILGSLGIAVHEIRVVGDVEGRIVDALNALRAAHDLVFTTGGIGPTHDDITADAVAKAFGVSIDYHPEAYRLLEARYLPGEFNEARKRMARIPQGAALIPNAVSVAPGFHIGNVYVMAGVPMVMRAMLEQVVPQLPHGAPNIAITIEAKVMEGAVAARLAAIQKQEPDVAIGSYPFYRDTGSGVQLVARGRDRYAVERAAAAIEAYLRELGVAAQRIKQVVPDGQS